MKATCQQVGQGAKIYPGFQDQQLACHRCIDVGRKCKTPGCETKDFITHGIADSLNFMLLSVPFAPKSDRDNVVVDPDG